MIARLYYVALWPLLRWWDHRYGKTQEATDDAI